jgi:peptidoglycan/xylan/chitin deacetylase (PgdA/CDA1 family)
MILSPVTILLGRLFCAALYYSGLNWVFKFLFRRNQIVVLMYHRILDSANLGPLDAQFLYPGMYVTKRAFEMQMEYIARNYNVVTTAQLVSALKQGEDLPRNPCVITFDDGWRDTYTHVFPILRKHHLPATIFLVSDYMGTNGWFWPEKTSFLLSKCLALGGLEGQWVTSCITIKRSGLSSLLLNPRLTHTKRIVAFVEALKALGAKDRDAIIRELEGVLKAHHIETTYPERLILSWDEATEMSANRITFGAHTKTHPILTKIRLPEAEREIVQSKTAIEEHLGTVCSSFCYPNGDYNDEIKEQVMATYSCAFSTHIGFVKRNDDLFALNRVGIRDEASFTRAMFACKVTGILEPIVSVMRKLNASSRSRWASAIQPWR